MHALTILHRILSASLPEIHTKRLTSLLAAVKAIVSGSRLTLSDMGRGLSGPVAVKHNIKRIDRLLGNSALHTEVPKLYEVLLGQCLEGMSTPLIVSAPATAIYSARPDVGKVAACKFHGSNFSISSAVFAAGRCSSTWRSQVYGSMPFALAVSTSE
jgi:hypothetical protein